VSNFLDRVGGIVVHPRATLRATAATGEGGLRDVAILLFLRVLAGETLTIAKAFLSLPSMGLGGMLRELSRAAMAIVPDVLGILIAAVLMALLAGRKSRAARGSELDVAAYAWVPYLVVSVATALILSIAGYSGGLVEKIAIVIALGWSAAVWILGLIELRATGAAT
jgi:hypothetical protein